MGKSIFLLTAAIGMLTVSGCSNGGSFGSSTPAWGQMTEMGGRIMQGTPRPQVSWSWLFG